MFYSFWIRPWRRALIPLAFAAPGLLRFRICPDYGDRNNHWHRYGRKRCAHL